MEILSTIKDKRINSLNLLIECTFEEYLRFAPSVIKNNEFQRKRVKTSKTVYALLRDDLEKGCVIPPIVLAISDVKNSENGDRLLEEICADTQKVMILDGLQRTYTLIDADSEVKGTERYAEFLGQKLRLEVYMELNKFGVLYRMLTLNTGQTPMSVRHQLEMMYRDMLDTNLEGVKIIRDIDGSANPDENQFVFKNTIDGFNSYLNRKEFPIDREELLDNIKVLEKMSVEAAGKDIYREYVMCYASVVQSFRTITGDHEVTNEEIEEYEISGSPFGKKASKIFSTSQAMTGFGAAIGKLKDSNLCKGFDDINSRLRALQADKSEESYEWLLFLLKKLDIIRNTSKKIGNAQRMLFQYFYRELFNPDSDSYLELEKAVENGYQKYQSQVE